MHLLKPTAAAALLASLLTACQSTTANDLPATLAPAQKQLKVTFDGQTRVYNNPSFAVGQLGALKGLDITAHSEAAGDLGVFVFATQAGTFPYRPAMSQHANVSQVEYKLDGKVFNNYKALVCPTAAGYYSTQGQVVVTEYVPGKLLRGTFSGALLDQNDPDECNKQGKPFSGKFYITKP